jgi:hypothetical protein
MKATVWGKSPLKERKDGETTGRRSPKFTGNPSILHLQQLGSYRKSAKLALNENNMKNINTSLALEEISYKNFQKRQAEDRLFLTYKRNPFSMEEEQS